MEYQVASIQDSETQERIRMSTGRPYAKTILSLFGSLPGSEVVPPKPIDPLSARGPEGSTSRSSRPQI